MKALLVAGGQPENWPQFDTDEYHYIVGIDRGALFLCQKGITPQLAIGDFDSLSQAEKRIVFETAEEVIQAPAEKDETDTQLAVLTVLERQPQAEMTLIGITGGRLDHLLANLWLGLEPRFSPYLSQFILKDNQNEWRYYKAGNYIVPRNLDMQYLAYCCLTPVKNLVLKDSKYTLSGVDVAVPTSYASNEFVDDTVSFSFDEGIVAVIQSKDK